MCLYDIALNFITGDFRQLGCSAFAWDFGQNSSITLANAKLQISLFLSKELIFTKARKNQPLN